MRNEQRPRSVCGVLALVVAVTACDGVEPDQYDASFPLGGRGQAATA